MVLARPHVRADERARPVSTISLPSRLLLLLLVLGTTSQARAQIQSPAQRSCLAAASQGFRAVVRAQQKEIERCVGLGARRHLPAGQTVASCIDDDAAPRVVRAVARLDQRESATCATAPDFGYVPGAAQAEGRDVARDLARDVFGSAVDAALANDAAGARCQRRVLEAAGRCATSFVNEYGLCKRSALRAGATAVDELVACKGADDRERLRHACRTSIADTVAKACGGADLDALFPGCAGLPLDGCVEGHALHRPGRALDATDGTCAPIGPPAPAPEPVDVVSVPLPPEVTELQLPWWTVDGSRIVFSARLVGYPDLQIATIAPDGSDFHCLTCALAAPGDPPLMKPFPVADGQRIVVRLGNQTPFTNSPHGVLECSPSVLDCQTAAILPIEIPALGDANLVQPQREFRVSPDGEHVAFTQMRNDTAGSQQFISIVGTLARFADHYEVLDPRVVSPLGELKQFSRDNQSVYVAAFVTNPFGAANSDALQIDLATGAVLGRVTKHPAYDEPVELSPDDQWFLVGSGRTAGLAETFSQLERPSLISEAIGNVTFYYFLTQRPALLEPWLVDRYGARDGYIGQPLKPLGTRDGWDGLMIPNWHPDGTRIVWYERNLDPSLLAPGDITTRLRIATLTSRSPVVSPVLPQPLPSLAWAPPLSGYVPPASPEPATRDGMFAGRADVVFVPGPTNHVEITYSGYSDDGRTFLDGTEVADYVAGLLGSSTYAADVTQHGCKQGFLRASGVGISISSLTGRTTSSVDGNVLTSP